MVPARHAHNSKVQLPNMLVHLQLVNQENSSQRLVHVILVIHMRTLMGQKEDVFYQNAVTEPRHLLMELVIHAQIMN